MLLDLLDISIKYVFGGGEGKLGVSGLGFRGIYLGVRVGFEVQGSRSRRLKIFFFCLSSRGVLIRHMPVAASL